MTDTKYPLLQSFMEKSTNPQPVSKINLSFQKTQQINNKVISGTENKLKIKAKLINLFNDLKGMPEDEFIDTSTLVRFLISFSVHKKAPSFFYEIYQKTKEIKRFSQQEFCDTFLHFDCPDFQEVENQRTLFEILEENEEGIITKDSFLKSLQNIELYQNNKELIQQNINLGFDLIFRQFKQENLSPEIFYLMLWPYENEGSINVAKTI